MLVNGSKPGGTVHYPTSVTAADSVAFVGLISLYQRNTTNNRPSLLNANRIPLHEWDIDPYHNSRSIENPMVKDTHARGAMWTETLAPTMYAAVEYGRYSSDYAWLESLYALAREFTGLSGGSTHLCPTPRESNGLIDAYTDMIGGEPLQANMRGAIDGSLYVVNAAQQIIIPSSAGGGGGGGSNTSFAGGGGAGEKKWAEIDSVSGTYVVRVGSGGAGGIGVAGTSGGFTAFSAVCSASGGKGGVMTNSATFDLAFAGASALGTGGASSVGSTGGAGAANSGDGGGGGAGNNITGGKGGSGRVLVWEFV